MNPNDFESVDVLRDAIATAQYRNRGSNGVIVATTKKGRVGKMVISYNGQYGVTQPGEEKFEMMNSAQLLQYQEILGKQQSNSLPGWVYSRNNQLYMSLRDDGRGFNSTQKTHRNGLKNLHYRVAKWEGVIEIRSEAGKGTHIELHMPLQG